jgi:hypothetical protein
MSMSPAIHFPGQHEQRAPVSSCNAESNLASSHFNPGQRCLSPLGFRARQNPRLNDLNPQFNASIHPEFTHTHTHNLISYDRKRIIKFLCLHRYM